MRIMEVSAVEGDVGAEENQGQLHVAVRLARKALLGVSMRGIPASLINALFKICVRRGQQLQHYTPGPYL